MRILSVIGTRPEAIKLAPVIIALEKDERFESLVCVTAQHREMLNQVLSLFEIKPHYDLNIMKSRQDLFDVTVNALRGLKDIIRESKPNMVLVQGDTATTFSASLAAFYYQTKLGHVEAGLRTFDKYAPFPEEINRQLISRIADLHFAPTRRAKQNLLDENVPKESIYITGNTAIDALFLALEKLRSNSCDNTVSQLKNHFGMIPDKLLIHLQNSKHRLVLVTGHRRENFGSGFKNICYALRDISRRDDVEIVYPVHPNPNVREPVKRLLQNYKNIHLIEPLDYFSFVYLMEKSYLIITDSGGIQEEAPSLGKPVLVMRELTERPEAVEAGTVKLVGTDRKKIVSSANQLLDDVSEYRKMAFAHNPYGDGKATEKILTILSNFR